jgi:hypothetical protein
MEEQGMSNFTQIVAISALGLSACFFVVYYTGVANAWGDQIITGFIRDHPIPIAQRWLRLYSNWTSLVTGGTAATLGVAIAEIVIAGHVGHADSKLVAYLFAFGLSIAAVMWLVQGPVLFLSYRSLLRQAEAD